MLCHILTLDHHRLAYNSQDVAHLLTVCNIVCENFCCFQIKKGISNIAERRRENVESEHKKEMISTISLFYVVRSSYLYLFKFTANYQKLEILATRV